jgi:hypothetical protein
VAWQTESVKVVFDAELWLWDARRTETWTFVSLPASQAGYVLPVKRQVRVAEALDVGDTATVTVELIDFA